MDKKFNKKKLIIYIVLFLVIGVIILLLFLLLPKKETPPDPIDESKTLYDNLVISINKEVGNVLEGVNIESSKVNNIIYTSNDNSLYVNYSYNTDGVLLLKFNYTVNDNINTILDYVYDNKALPNHAPLDDYYITKSTSGDNYKDVINNHYNKTFTKLTTSLSPNGVNAYVSALAKNNDNESITTVDRFKVKVDGLDIIDSGIDITVNKDNSRYYSLLNYLLNN